MPNYTVTIRWLNPSTGTFEPVTVRGVWQGSQVRPLVYRDVYYASTQPAPEPPIINSVFFNAEDSVTVEWQLGYNSENPSDFEIFRNGASQGHVAGNLRTFTQTVPTATPPPTFTYTMRLTDPDGTSDFSSPWLAQYTGPTNAKPPTAPTGLTVTFVGPSSAVLTWSESSDPTVQGHRIFRNGTLLMVDTPPLDADSRTYTLTSLGAATTYSNVNVKRYNSVGQSLGSNFVTFTTGPGNSQFPGHQAGLVYLGISTDQTFDSRDTLIGTTTALGRISDSGSTGDTTARVAAYFAKMNEVLIDGKMPWLSFTPADIGLTGTDVTNWNAIAAGSTVIDAALEQYFDAISELPNNNFCMLSFSPKPTLPNAAAATAFCNAHAYIGAHWAAYNNKANGIYGPILDEVHFGEIQAGTRTASQLVNNTVAANAEFIGIDIFQDNRLTPAVLGGTRLDYIVAQYQTTNFADLMFAVSDFGGSNVFRQGGTYKTLTLPVDGTKLTGSQWESELMAHCFGLKNRYFALCQRDSTALLNGAYWALDEAAVLTGPGTLDSAPTSKLNVYRGYLNGTSIARQQGVDVTRVPQVTAVLNKSTYQVNEQMTLTVTENITVKRTFVITDPNATWTLISDNGNTLVYRATAGSAGTGRSVNVRMTRTFDGRTATATANYGVSGVIASSVMMMGCSDSNNDHGGTEVWEGWRVYTEGAMDSRSNRTGTQRPKFLAYSEAGNPMSGSRDVVFNHVKAKLDDFYYNGTGQTHSARWGIKLYWSNGNENSDKGVLSGTHTSASIAAFVASQRGLYEAVHFIDPATNQRRYPDAYAGSNPTQNHELKGIVADWLHPSARYHDFVMWSMYPPGRSGNADPTYNWPSYVESRRTDLQDGFLIRTYYRTKQAEAQARIDTGNSALRMAISCGEVGIGSAGPSSNNDTTARPYYAVHALAGGMQHLADQYQFDMPFACWWDNDGGANTPQNILTDEPSGTNPSTREAWQNWKQYNHLYGGTHPASWANNPKAAWSQTGTAI